MKKHPLWIVFMLVAIILLASCSNTEKKVTLTISAAASLTDVMEEVKHLYEKHNNHVILIMNYGSSGALQQQIIQGAPVDIYLSAASAQMDELDKQGLIINESRVNLLKNNLVLIAAKNNLQLVSFKDLTAMQIKKIGIGEPNSVPAGYYAKEAFISMQLWDDLEEKLVFGKDVRQVLTWVETGNVDAGLVYKTDALASDCQIIAVVPENAHTPIVCPAAVIKVTKSRQEAFEFMAFLRGEQAREVFVKHGFEFIPGE